MQKWYNDDMICYILKLKILNSKQKRPKIDLFHVILQLLLLLLLL